MPPASGIKPIFEKAWMKEAERIGLIWRCVDDVALMDTALAMAQRLAAMPSRALVATRRVIDAGSRSSLADAVTLEARTQGELGRAPDFAEGVAAFLGKRAAKFKDR